MVSPGRDFPNRGSCSSAEGPVSRILSCAVIPLGAALPRTLISDLPGGFGNCSSRLAASGRCAAPPGSFAVLPSLFGLAPCGVYPATAITGCAVRSYRTFSPLPPLRGAALWSKSLGYPMDALPKSCPTQWWRYVLCGTSRPRALTPASRTLSGTLPCGVRTFLSRQPVLAQGFPAATARSSCQSIVYRESG